MWSSVWFEAEASFYVFVTQDRNGNQLQERSLNEVRTFSFIFNLLFCNFAFVCGGNNDEVSTLSPGGPSATGQSEHTASCSAGQKQVIYSFYFFINLMLISHFDDLTRPQAAVIRQDSILELSVTAGPAPGPALAPRLSRSVSRDTGIDATGEVVLLRRQVELLKEEVTWLRLRRVGLDGRMQNNRESSDVIQEGQVGLTVGEQI